MSVILSIHSFIAVYMLDMGDTLTPYPHPTHIPSSQSKQVIVNLCDKTFGVDAGVTLRRTVEP